MSELLLSADTGREEGTRSSRRLRREGRIPAVVYGHGADPVSVSVAWPDLRQVLTTDAGLNALITLSIDGDECLSVVKDLQRHPVRRDVIHVDFIRVRADQEIEVSVPLTLVGEAKNVTAFDGMVDQTLYDLTLLVVPTNVPQELVIDISDLELGETVKVGDLDLPEGASTPVDLEETVAIALITRSTREAIRRAEEGDVEEADAAAAAAGDDGAGDDDAEG